jgi:hypothetical protein
MPVSAQSVQICFIISCADCQCIRNAGNDALYTLKVFMKLAESESRARAEQRAAGSSAPRMSATRL